MYENPLLTIFTPTYNRCEKLKLLYEDLKLQTNKNFVWLVVDDGSTDDTKSFIKTILEENVIKIQYQIKENGGKHTAYNLACNIADTELIFIAMDSDDRLKKNAVEQIARCWENHKNEGIAGLVFLCENSNGEKLCSIYNREQLKYNPSWAKAYSNKMFWGEAEYILRTEYAKQFLYPEYIGERFFNEAYTYMQMQDNLFWNDSSIYVREYQEEGLSRNFLKNVYNSPNGYADYNNVKAKVSKELSVKMKATLFFDVFSILGHNKNIIRKSNLSFLALFLFPAAFAISMALRIKFRRET